MVVHRVSFLLMSLRSRLFVAQGGRGINRECTLYRDGGRCESKQCERNRYRSNVTRSVDFTPHSKCSTTWRSVIAAPTPTTRPVNRNVELLTHGCEGNPRHHALPSAVFG